MIDPRPLESQLLENKTLADFSPAGRWSVTEMWSWLRPSFLALVAVAVALPLAIAWDRWREPSQDQLPTTAAGTLGIKFPSPSISPEDVVRIQMAGLMNRSEPAKGILQCYSFASPGNRAVTGPLERFAMMVRQPPYDLLCQAQTPLIGAAQANGDQVRVLVSLIVNRELHLFVFVLRRQTEQPFVGCWMTEGVYYVPREKTLST